MLKQEWGFDGLVMSDWFATKRAVESANAGLDLVMPGPATVWSTSLEKAVLSGAVSEETIDDHVRRLLTLTARVGALGAPRSWGEPVARPDSSARREQLKRIAAQGMTVLKNENAVLPLSKGMPWPESSVLDGQLIRAPVKHDSYSRVPKKRAVQSHAN